jgi:hypothetical protein
VDVGDHAGREHARAMVRGIKTGVEIDRGVAAVQTDRGGHLLERCAPLREPHHLRLMDRCDGAWRSHLAMVGRPGDALLPGVVLRARVAAPIAPFGATVCVPSPWSTPRSRCCAAERGATRAMNACSSDPSGAHVAQALYTLVSCLAGWPWGSCGMGTHVHGMPVESTPTSRFTRP